MHRNGLLRATPAVLAALLAVLAAGGCAGLRQGSDSAPSGEVGRTSAAGIRLEPAGSLEPPSGMARFDPGAVAADVRGRVFVSDKSRGTVYVYQGPGQPTGVLADPPAGSVGTGPRFGHVTSIVTTSGLSVYVLDSVAGIVYSYDLANQLRGTVLELEGPPVETTFGRVRATSLLVDRTGQPVVSDREGDRLLVFNPQWEPSHAIGGPGLTAGGFRDPVALASDDRGRIVVADRGNRVVQLLSQAGAFLDEFPMEHAPESVTATPDGDIFVGDAAGFIVVLPAAGGRSLVPPPSGGSGPVYVAASPDGKLLYAARSTSGVVEVMNIVSPGDSP